MILVLLTLASFAATAASSWLLMRWLSRAVHHHRQAFERQAGRNLTDMFLFLDPAQVWAASLAAGMLVALLVQGISGAWWLSASALVIMLVIPAYGLRWLRARRLQRLDEQLPDLLLALAGALRAGTGIQAALRHVGEHISPPLSHELALMQREQRLGVPLEEALQGFGRRIPTEGAQLVVSALRIAMQTGGSLAQTLERIATTLRARLYLQGRVRALTAQGRLQAWVMAMLPIALAGALSWLDPVSMEKLWSTPSGWLVMAIIAGLEVAGLLMIRRIVMIRV